MQTLPKGYIIAGRYEVIELLGMGATGTVYRISDRHLYQELAIKVVCSPKISNDQHSQPNESLQRERDLLSHLRHPALARVYDFFAENETSYLVTDLILGNDLSRILERESCIDQERIINWAIQILQVLDYLHKQKTPIVFRDLKPSNIMLTPEGNIVLIDFGIARIVRQQAKTRNTSIGTEGYAPLEQYQGKAEPRSDLYALGVIMHQLLTGEDPIPFHLTPINDRLSSTSPGLIKIIKIATAEKVEDRFRTAGEMRSNLEAILRNPHPKPVQTISDLFEITTQDLIMEISKYIEYFKDPDQIREDINLLRELFRQQNVEFVLKCLNRIRKYMNESQTYSNPSAKAVMTYLDGFCEEALGGFSKALQRYRAALKINHGQYIDHSETFNRAIQRIIEKIRRKKTATSDRKKLKIENTLKKARNLFSNIFEKIFEGINGAINNPPDL